MKLFGDYVLPPVIPHLPGAEEDSHHSLVCYKSLEGDARPFRHLSVQGSLDPKLPFFASIGGSASLSEVVLRQDALDPERIAHFGIWVYVASHKRLRIQWSRSSRVFPLDTAAFGSAVAAIVPLHPEDRDLGTYHPCELTFTHREFVEKAMLDPATGVVSINSSKEYIC